MEDEGMICLVQQCFNECFDETFENGIIIKLNKNSRHESNLL